MSPPPLAAGAARAHLDLASKLNAQPGGRGTELMLVAPSSRELFSHARAGLAWARSPIAGRRAASFVSATRKLHQFGRLSL